MNSRAINFIFFCIFFVVFNGYTTPKQDSLLLFEKYFSKAKEYINIGEYDSAIISCKTALLYTSDLTKVFQVNRQLAWSFSDKKEIDSALFYLNKNIQKDLFQQSTIQLKREKATSYSVISIMLEYQGNYLEAQYAIKKAIKILESDTIDQSGLIGSYRNLGTSYLRLGQYEEALECMETSEQLTAKSTVPDLLVHMIGNSSVIGLIEMRKENYHKALKYFQYLIKLIENKKEEYRNDYFFTILNIGDAYNHLGEYDSALVYYEKGQSYIHVIENSPLYHNYSFSYKKLFFTGLGTSFFGKDDFIQSRKYFLKAINTVIREHGKQYPSLMPLYIQMAALSRHQGYYAESIAYCDEAIVIGKKTYGSKHKNLSQAYNEKGETLYEQQFHYKAYQCYDSALLSNPELVIAGNSYFSSPRESIVALHGKMLSVPHFLDKKEYEIQLEEVFRNSMNELNFTLNKNDQILIDQKQALMELLNNEFVMQYEENRTITSLQKSWKISEYTKARKLTSQINSKGVLDQYVSSETFEREKELKDSITYCLNKKSEGDDNDSLLFVLNNKYDHLLKRIESENPKYYQLKYDVKTVSIEQVQKRIIKEGQTLVEYFLGDDNLYIYAVNKSNYEVKIILRDSLFDQQLDIFRKALQLPNLVNHSLEDYQEFVSSASALYNYLIAPISSLIEGNELIIIPDGELALIPFEALLANKSYSEEVNYQLLPYLIKEYTVSYANSATLLFNEMENAKTVRKKTNGNILAFAPEFGSEPIAFDNVDTIRSKLGPLKWIEEEVNGISTYFDSRVYRKTNATERAFRKEEKEYSIIHIASHAVVNDENPMYSKIAFTVDEADTLNDGYLHAFELYNTQLNAEMVVLSACNTGYGKVVKGEGVLNLARSFFYAGCKSVVMSLWVANDRSTASLMEDFYKHLADDQTKNKALQNSKLEYLENNEGLKAHPYYWSQFVLSGNTDPISKSKSNNLLIFATMGGLMLLLLSAYFVRRNRFTD